MVVISGFVKTAVESGYPGLPLILRQTYDIFLDKPKYFFKKK